MDWSIESYTMLEEMRSDALDAAYERKNERYVRALETAVEDVDDAKEWEPEEATAAIEALEAFYEECQYEGIDIPSDLEDEVQKRLKK